MLAPFGVEQEEKTADDKILIVCFQALTSACPGQGQTDSRTTTHSKFSWFPKLPDSNSQRGPWVTDVPPDAGRHPLRYQSELETGSLVPNFCHGSAVWLKGPKAKCQRGHVITWLYKIYIREVKLTIFWYCCCRRGRGCCCSCGSPNLQTLSFPWATKSTTKRPRNSRALWWNRLLTNSSFTIEVVVLPLETGAEPLLRLRWERAVTGRGRSCRTQQDSRQNQFAWCF